MQQQSDAPAGFAEGFCANPLRALCVPRDATIEETLAVIDGGAKEIAPVAGGAGLLIGAVTDGDTRARACCSMRLDGTGRSFWFLSF